MPRHFETLDLRELRTLFEGRQDDAEYLRGLVQELAFRRGRDAQALLIEIAECLREQEELLNDTQSDDEPEQGAPSLEGLSITELRNLFIHHLDDANQLFAIGVELGMRGGSQSAQLLAHVREQLQELGDERAEQLVHPTESDFDSEAGEDPEPVPTDFGKQRDGAEGKSGASSKSVGVEDHWAGPRGEVLPVVGRFQGEAFDTSGWTVERPEIRPLRTASSDEAYELHLAACEWGLDPAILIRDADDIQARKHWSEHLEPYAHQVRNLITFCRRAPVALISDDVGLGKTISAGLILSELMARKKVTRALIIVPKRVLLSQWCAELREKFRLNARYATGNEFDALLRGSAEIVITTYQTARSRLARIGDNEFDMLILDEAHHLRNLYGTSSPPRIAEEMHEALARRAFRYVLMLTATPIHNRLWDLYSLVHLLAVAKGHENPLGNENQFAHRYIADNKASARRLNPGRRDEFRRILSQYMVRTRRGDAGLVFPQREVILRAARGSEEEQALIAIVGKNLASLSSPLSQVSLAQALMSSPEALVRQLTNMVEKGTVSRGFLAEVETVVSRIEQTAKLRTLLNLVDELRSARPLGWRLLVFTGRQETQEAIGRALTHMLGSGSVGFIRRSDAHGNARSIESYCAEPPSVHVIVSTDAGSEGLNLQAGNVVVNYDLPWNPMIMEQRIGRVQRLGSKFASVTVLNLVLAGSVEESVVGRLAEKLSVIANAIGDVEGILETLSGSGEEDRFENEIRDMVLRSLKGMDIEDALQKMQRSIDEARLLYEEEKGNVDETIGTLDEMHEAGPKMPDLSPIEPRMSDKEFTLRAMREGDGLLEELPGGRWKYTKAGFAPEEVVFTREDLELRRPSGFAGGPRVSLYRTGQPAFEKLAQEWRGSSQTAIRDRRSLDEARAREVAQAWMDGLGDVVQVDRMELSRSSVGFNGEVVVRAASSVAHDKYERLVTVSAGPQGMDPPSGDSDELPLISGQVDTGGLMGGEEVLVDALLRGLARDRDLGQFSAFYTHRLAEELRKVGGDVDRSRVVEQNFTPSVTSLVVGARGELVSMAEIEVEYRVNGGGPYKTTLRVEPGSSVPHEPPATDACELSGVLVPTECLEECAFSGKRVLRHLLVLSEFSRRRGVPDALVTCEVSGKRLLRDEVGVSMVSHRTVHIDLLVPSDLSGRLALPDEMKTCAFTGARLLPEEAGTSEVSGRLSRSDQVVLGGREPRRGHVSEFQECAESRRWFLPGELAVSDLSGRAVDASLLVASEKSGRRGTPAETGICAATGRRLLMDELVACQASGEIVDVALIAVSARSGVRARRDLFVTCEATGVLLLPQETGISDASGKRVDLRLLKRSGASTARALAEELEVCESSGLKVLPCELVTCASTGERVLTSLVERCALTGRVLQRELMVEDAQSPGEWLSVDAAGYSELSKRATRPELLVACEWSERLCLPDELGRCELTGLTVASIYLDEDSRLLPLVALLETPTGGDYLEPSVLAGVEIDGVKNPTKLRDLRTSFGPSDDVMAVVGSVKSMLGMRTRRVAFVLDRNRRVIGDVVVE